MFYDARKNDHGLPHDPVKAIIAPRPIGWITSMSAKGEINLRALFTSSTALSSRPFRVMFSSEGRKDSLAFIIETKEFVCNLATWDLRDAMNKTSAPMARGVNEMEQAGLAAAPSRLGEAAAGCCIALCSGMSVAANRADQRHRGPLDRLPCGVRASHRRPHR